MEMVGGHRGWDWSLYQLYELEQVTSSLWVSILNCKLRMQRVLPCGATEREVLALK